MIYYRTKDKEGKQYIINDKDFIFQVRGDKIIFARGWTETIMSQSEAIEDLLDEIVIIEEDGQEYKVVFLPDTYEAMIRRQEEEDYKGRLIGRIKVGLNKQAVAEWKANKEGLYDWVLL